MKLLVLHDRKVMTCCAICIIPCFPCLPCNYSFEHAFLHICEKETEICSVIYVGSWSCGGRGGVLQSAFNRFQKTIGSIALGGLGAYEETLGVAHVC